MIEIIIKPFADGLRPIPLLTVSQWADQYRFLTSASSSEPGRYRTSRMPFLREIADHLGKTSDAQEIVCMKGAQVGFTELGNCWIGYTIHIDPGPMMLVMPTDEVIKKNSRTRIKPMIESTPALNERIKAVGSKDAENTINSKSFPGGVLIMIGANSPVGLSSTPAGKLFLDEVDRYPLSAGDEGSPIDLVRARARTFSNKKIFIISTPTNEGESVIAKEFEEGDKRYYNVPCQGCGDLFVLKFNYFTYDESDPTTTRMACPNCGFLHEERHKTTMLAEEGFGGSAKWIPTKKSDNPRKYSYHLSSLYSPSGFYSWEDLIRDYLKVKNDANKMRTFINTVLGETYKIKGESPNFENLYNRREDYEIGIIPDEVCFLTMGVDIQGDRIEAELVGWCRGRTSYSVKYYVLIGDTQKKEVWELLREVINMQFESESGYLMPISLTAIDAGYNTSTVYDFTAQFGYNKVIPIMGRDAVRDVMVSPPRAININRDGKKIKGTKVWYLGTSLLKSELYGFLKLQAKEVDGEEVFPDGYCHFPQYDRYYFKMLTAEELRLSKNKKGFDEFQWVKKFERNEALDVRCYARAAAYVLGIDRFKEDTWDKFKEQVMSEKIEKSVTAPVKKKKSNYWDR